MNIATFFSTTTPRPASAVLPPRRTRGERLAQAMIESPLGPLTALAAEDGLLGLWFDAQLHAPGPLDAPVDAAQRWIEQARRELDAYFAGRLRRFEVPVAPRGTPFQEAVWQRLLGIDWGATTSYSRIARALGHPQAARAVGSAVGRNPIAILVPCHRVVGEQGALTGYAAGLDRKRALLALEQHPMQTSLPWTG